MKHLITTFKHLAEWSIPLLMIMVMALLSSLKPTATSTPTTATTSKSVAPSGRVVVLIIDSLRRQTLNAHMPHLKAWSQQQHTIDMDVHTCSANYTVPCVQTLMEGRQSPFVAGLHNFTGKKSGGASLPAQVKKAGFHQILISDFTLDTLYGNHANTSLNIENWPGGLLHHDQRAIKEAGELLETTPDLNMMVLHIVGTDKIAHRKTPKHPEYAKHYKIVDEDIKKFLSHLRPEDHVIITGDHGHDEKGHHNRNSMVLMRSPLLTPLLPVAVEPKLEQHEITYFMWFVLGLPVAAAYEGRYFGIETDPVSTPQAFKAHLERFKITQQRTLNDAGFAAPKLGEQITNKRTKMRNEPLNSALRYSPMILIYLWWIFWMITSIRASSRWRGVVLGVGANTVALVVGMFAPPWAMGVLAGCIALAMLKHMWSRTTTSQKRLFSWLTILLAMGALAALAGPRWAAFWHTKGGFQLTTPLFFVGLIGLGIIGSKWRSNTWWRYMPESLGATCLLALPSGVYFYQYGQNIIRGFFIGMLFLMLGRLIQLIKKRRMPRVDSKRDMFAVLLLAFTAVMLMRQTAGGWEWHFILTRSLKRAQPAIPLLIYGGLALASLAVLRLHIKSFLIWAVVWTLPLLYSAYIGELTLATLAGTSIPMAFAFAFARVTQGPNAFRTGDELEDERTGWWLVAISIITLWIILSGFFIGQVDFNFTFPYLTAFKKESTVAFWSSWMTLAKYAFPAWLWVFALFMFRDRARWLRQMSWFWALLHLKCLALFLHIFCGPLISEQKLYELSISELMFTMTAGWITIAAVSFIALGQGIFAKKDVEHTTDNTPTDVEPAP